MSNSRLLSKRTTIQFLPVILFILVLTEVVVLQIQTKASARVCTRLINCFLSPNFSTGFSYSSNLLKVYSVVAVLITRRLVMLEVRASWIVGYRLCIHSVNYLPRLHEGNKRSMQIVQRDNPGPLKQQRMKKLLNSGNAFLFSDSPHYFAFTLTYLPLDLTYNTS